MRTIQHTLLCSPLGTLRTLQSLHFGVAGSGEKAYIQASLHADELPGMLVIHHLRGLLEKAEQERLIRGEIVLVPVANPIGLAQALLYQALGRFELETVQNFNRGFPDLLALLGDEIERDLGSDPNANRAAIRRRLGTALAELAPATELESLRVMLTRLAFDADVVLDLHCDEESVLHLYTETPYWPQAEPLARYLGTRANLLAIGQGARSFDEAMSGIWWQLDQELAARHGKRFPIPLGCFAATIEHRGQADVQPELARQDARALFAYLQYRGLIAGDAPRLPELAHRATPLAGSEDVHAPHAGLLYFLREPGDWIEAGQPVAEMLDPFANRTTPVHASVSGVLYGRIRERYVTANRILCRIAGDVAFRSGPLLAP